MAIILHVMSHYCTSWPIVSRNSESCDDCNPQRDSNPERQREINRAEQNWNGGWSHLSPPCLCCPSLDMTCKVWLAQEERTSCAVLWCIVVVTVYCWRCSCAWPAHRGESERHCPWCSIVCAASSLTPPPKNRAPPGQSQPSWWACWLCWRRLPSPCCSRT